MSKTAQSKNAYNKITQDYDNTYVGRFTAQFKQELVSAVKLKPEDNVLDVACGNGTLLAMLARKTKINGYGVDISENMIAEAKRLYPDFQYAVSGCEELSFEDNYFDAVTVSAAFHHFERPDLVLKEAKRVLKQGGELFIAETNWNFVLRSLANVFCHCLNPVM